VRILTGAVWYTDVVVVVSRLLELTVLYNEFCYLCRRSIQFLVELTATMQYRDWHY